ncbi:hypothetical protein [Actinomadura decatromicini]|nr:hypothetical protein [Actinomadura decatromicini]
MKLALGGVGGVAAVLVLLGARAALHAGADPGAALRADARRVHCLSAKQRPELVQAAVRLGIAAPGSTDARFLPLRDGRPAAPRTLDEWSRTSPADFDRACGPLAAVTGAKSLQDPPPKPELWKQVAANPLCTLLLGAFLTFATAAATARTARRQTLTDQLNSAAAEYLKAAQAARVARSRERAADVTGLEGRRVDLLSALLRAGRRGAELRNLQGLLETAHKAVMAGPFEAAPAEEGLRRLEAALVKAVRGGRMLSGGRT